MSHEAILRIVREAVRGAHAQEAPLWDSHGKVPVTHYSDPSRLERERRGLFRKMPLPIAHASELAAPGACLVREIDGVSLALVRDGDGHVRVFKNACRHRGTRVLHQDCRVKGLVCPYHGWVYGLDGALLHVPHERAFPGLDKSAEGLVPAPSEERHGFVWVTLDADGGTSPAAHLAPIDEELASLSLATHVAHKRVVREQRGNWKMLVEAFLEGYHVRNLHRDTVYPFFLDARSHAERAGLHVRHATARRAALKVSPEELGGHPLRDLATFAYVIFPSTTLIAHPDWTSHIIVLPLGVDRFVWQHTMLLPRAPENEEERAHYDRSFALIEENVFQREDLFAVSEMQAGIETGALDAVRFGRLESAALWLHDAIREVLGE